YQPKFEGLLSQATYIADISQSTVVDYASYRDTLAEFVGQVSALYIAADSLPVGLSSEELITVLHISDVHDNPQAFDVVEELDSQFAIDLVIDTGDIVSWGTQFENDLLHPIGGLDVPYVFVSGNHDGQATSATIAAHDNAIVLENEVAEVGGLTIAGIGDPRFAADDDSDAGGWQAGKDAVSTSGFQPVDTARTHAPTQPAGRRGRTSLVRSGHMHTASVGLDRDGSGTDWLTVGSTGAALASGGVRPVLDGEDPLELPARMLYFDAEPQ